MTLTKRIRIDDSALPILAGMEWQETPAGIAGRIAGGQLDRKLYEAVNKGLEALGGKWNRKVGAHLFERDPRGEIAAMLGSGFVVVERDGFFRTPRFVVERMIDMFERTVDPPILEPSAGDGAICDVWAEIYEMPHSDFHVIEKNDFRRSSLTQKRYQVVWDDFLTFEPDELYPTIIMNPPFEQGQDMQHITHAFENCLAEGGQLVSVVSDGPFFRGESAAQRFRSLVDSNGYAEPLPENAFRISGTGVKTRLVYLRK